jgi:hypothetical protein
LNTENARKIILNAVDTTKPTWSRWDVHWEDIDKIFLSRAYDQMGFDNGSLLIFSINTIYIRSKKSVQY